MSKLHHLTPAFVIDEDVLADAIREVYANMPDEEVPSSAPHAQLLAVADAYARLMRERGAA